VDPGETTIQITFRQCTGGATAKRDPAELELSKPRKVTLNLKN
jgi:hypothetical protein